uniref:Uncharacterized protein n=1 Tax=Tanacetum cinerariifolium TaxID=118510 RepID=A0A699H2W0_TANCI|nr:hypothetical protein [Tanacetum cinerariifolium]
MHKRASNFELVEPLLKPKRTLNRRLRQQNRRVPFEQRNNPPQHPRVVYPPILNINYFRHFIDILRNYNPMDDESMWVVDHVVALTPDFAITIFEIANEFAIKEIRAFFQHESESIPDAWLRMKEMLRNCHGHKMSKGNIIKIFYHGLNEKPQEVLNAAVGVIRVKQKQLNLGVKIERMIYHIDSAMKHSYSNNDTCFSIHVIDKILEEDFDALLDEESVEVFMDDFFVFRSSFDQCMNKLNKMLQRCKDAHLVLNWEKCHFMVKEGVMLGYKVSEASLEVEKAKINVISKLPPPTNIKVFAFDKFRSYSVPSKTIVHANHSTLRYLFKKQDAKQCLIRWILLLQEFDIEIKDRKGTKNVAADHLSRIETEETSDDSEVDDNFLGETLMEINIEDEPWFTNFANHLASDIILKGMTYRQKNIFLRHQTQLLVGTLPLQSMF